MRTSWSMLRRRLGDCMRFAWFCCTLVIFAPTMMLAQSNPVPFVNQILNPASVQPSSKEFLLTVKGTGFASTAVINWNGSPILTSVESASRLTSRTSAAKVRKGRYRFHHGDESRSNKGGTTLSITQITISGKNSGDFAQKNNCGQSVRAHDHCTISVTFTPTATGQRPGAVSVTDNGGGGPQSVPLAGTGT